MKNECLAIITARGGSRRIPKKNIRDFFGHPIIKYSIDAALSSDCFAEVMVSTDDEEIAKISQEYGAKIPFSRSKKNSDDFASTVDVLEEVLLEYRKRGKSFNFACCIYPTAPFISPDKLKKGYKLLIETGADSIVPVVRFSYPIQRAFRINNGKLEMIWPEDFHKRSQDLVPVYHDAGQFYWFKVKMFLDKKVLLTQSTMAFIVPESEVQDIDNMEDWKLAEIKFKALRCQT